MITAHLQKTEPGEETRRFAEAKSFASYLLQEGYASSTAATYRRSVAKLLRYMEAEGLAADEITYHDLLAWVRRQRCGRSSSPTPRTINAHLAAVRHWMEQLIRRGIREDNPAAGLTVRGARSRLPHDLLSEEELTQLYREHPSGDGHRQNYLTAGTSSVNLRDRCILGLIVFQALRRSELEALRPEHVALEEGYIRVPPVGRAEGRRLPLRPEQILPLARYLDSGLLSLSPKLFTSCGTSHGDVRRHKLGNVLQRLARKLRQRSPFFLGFTQLRSSRIALWIKTDGLRRAQYYAGHRYVSSTERYRAQDLESLQAQLEKHHPLA